MNPLELQVLSIVCGVATDQNAPATDANAPRPLAVVVLPVQEGAAVTANRRGTWPTNVSRGLRAPGR